MKYPSKHNYHTLEDYQDAVEDYHEWVDYKMDEARDEYLEEKMEGKENEYQ